jgi:hypothetical protein
MGKENVPFMLRQLMKVSNRLMAQSASMGALPQLYTGVSADVQGGDFYGPDGRSAMSGYPTKVESSTLSHDLEIAKALWEQSEEMTGITYSFA